MIQYQMDKKDINLHHIAQSGQCFRIKEFESPSGQRFYDVISSDKFIRVMESEQIYSFECDSNDVPFWVNYFDLKTDYSRFLEKIEQSNDQFLKSAASFGQGLRILNQDYWEMVISFIISQNNSIPRIKKIIEALCLKFGKVIHYKDEIYHAFPTKEELFQISFHDLGDIGLGYRDTYVYNACLCGWDMLKPTRETLLQLHGVGPKVASCILLYGAHDLDEYPVDTWMKRILDDVYGGDFDGSPYKGFLGFVQLLEFYYYRHLNGKFI